VEGKFFQKSALANSIDLVASLLFWDIFNLPGESVNQVGCCGRYTLSKVSSMLILYGTSSSEFFTSSANVVKFLGLSCKRALPRWCSLRNAPRNVESLPIVATHVLGSLLNCCLQHVTRLASSLATMSHFLGLFCKRALANRCHTCAREPTKLWLLMCHTTRELT